MPLGTSPDWVRRKLLFEADSGRDLPKRGTLDGDNFPMSNLGSGWVKLKAIHLYRSYLSSGLRARCEMELVCSSRYPYGDFLSIVEFFQTSTSMAVCFYGHFSAFSWSQSWITKANFPLGIELILLIIIIAVCS